MIRKHFNQAEYSRLKKQRSMFALLGLLIGVSVWIVSKSLLWGIISFVGSALLLIVGQILYRSLQMSANIEKMELIFPDFIQLVSSNLRAGMTVDKALLLSARSEFTPLDKEIILLGKAIITGKEIGIALKEMSIRVNSERITKTIELIITGLRSGGNLSVLLDQTALNMRERFFVEKRAASNVLMYVILIFFAMAAGAPMLFSLSSVLVEVLSAILSTLPSEQSVSTFGLTLTAVSIDVNFVIYFALAFMIVTDILATLVLGIVTKGDEKAGTKYILPIVAVGITVFFIIRSFLLNYFNNLFV